MKYPLHFSSSGALDLSLSFNNQKFLQSLLNYNHYLYRVAVEIDRKLQSSGKEAGAESFCSIENLQWWLGKKWWKTIIAGKQKIWKSKEKNFSQLLPFFLLPFLLSWKVWDFPISCLTLSIFLHLFWEKLLTCLRLQFVLLIFTAAPTITKKTWKLGREREIYHYNSKSIVSHNKKFHYHCSS